MLKVEDLTRNEICQLLESNGYVTEDRHSTEDLQETLRIAIVMGVLTLEWLRDGDWKETTE